MPHPWPVFTPEDNHTVLTRLGTGSATTLAYHAAVTAQVAHLESIAAASSASGAGTYGVGWQGVGAAASAVSQSGLNTATTALGAWLAAKLPLVASTVSAYHAAAAAMVPAEEAVANRLEEAVDEQINPWVWGALTPRIVALNLDYFGHMWPRNAAAGAAYGATAQASAVAMVAVPPPPALAGGSVAAPAAAAATVAEDGGVSAAGAAMRSTVRAAEAVISRATVVPQAMAQTPAGALGALRPLAAMAPAVAMTPSAPVGMFAPLSAATPAVETAVANEAGQLAAAPRGGAPTGMAYPGAGLTSYLRPTDGFSSPPAGGRPVGASPGMLNAATLRGPLTNTPPTAVVAQPLVPPAPANVRAPSAPASSGPATPTPRVFGPRPAAAAAQMLGFGPGPAPLGPPGPAPLPRDPAYMTTDEIRAAYEGLKAQIDTHNSWRPLPNDAAGVATYNAERDALNARRAELEAALRSRGVEISGESPANTFGTGPPAAARDSAPFPPPRDITGLTEHGEQQVNGRDGGHGVKDSAVQDAVTNPIGPPKYVPDPYRGTYKYVGKDATVALNENGEVVTAWANSRDGWRSP